MRRRSISRAIGLSSALVAVAIASTLVALPRTARSSESRREADASELREAARAVLVANCGKCHDPGSGASLKGALRVFNLIESDWSARMTSAQLHDAAGRLRDSVDATPSERATFERFVAWELERRSAR
jgi:hypothetical protein